VTAFDFPPFRWPHSDFGEMHVFVRNEWESMGRRQFHVLW
jgi:hypothetical protein